MSNVIGGAPGVGGPPYRGAIVGDVTGNVTGNLTGNVTGGVTGDVSGNLSGHVGDPQNVTPVNAVLATGGQLAYQNAVQPTAGKTVSIPSGSGVGYVYTFVADVAVAGDVKIGASSDATMLNLSRAINKNGGTEGVGQDYMAANGAAHPMVVAVHNAGGDLVTFTVQVKGVIGNIDITTDEATITPTDPSGGIDGTVGAKGDIRWDTNAIYVCTAANTTQGQNWKKTALGAL